MSLKLQKLDGIIVISDPKDWEGWLVWLSARQVMKGEVGSQVGPLPGPGHAQAFLGKVLQKL